MVEQGEGQDPDQGTVVDLDGVRVLTPVGTISDVQPQRQQRRLAEWQRRYPDLDITSVQTRGDTLDYLANNLKTRAEQLAAT